MSSVVLCACICRAKAFVQACRLSFTLAMRVYCSSLCLCIVHCTSVVLTDYNRTSAFHTAWAAYSSRVRAEFEYFRHFYVEFFHEKKYISTSDGLHQYGLAIWVCHSLSSWSLVPVLLRNESNINRSNSWQFCVIVLWFRIYHSVSVNSDFDPSNLREISTPANVTIASRNQCGTSKKKNGMRLEAKVIQSSRK